MSLNSSFKSIVFDNDLFQPSIMDTINSSFSELELPLHYLIKAKIRYQTFDEIPDGAVALSPHFLNLFMINYNNLSAQITSSIFLTQIKTIYFAEDKTLQLYININNDNENQQIIIIDSPQAMLLSQLIYRNIQIAFPKENFPVLHVRDNSLYPRLNLPLSPSQIFQFTYLSKCAALNIKYIHQLTQYIHKMILGQQMIFDVTQRPRELRNDPEMVPYYQTLAQLNYLSGICCANKRLNNCMDLLLQFIQNGVTFNILHFSNAYIRNGFSQLLDFAQQNKTPISFNYIDLSNNKKIEDFGYFLALLQKQSKPLILLNLSNMNLKPKHAANLFERMAQNPNLTQVRYLMLEDFPFDDKNVLKMIKFFEASAKYQQLNIIEYLDLSYNGENINAVLPLFLSTGNPLRVLKINDCVLSPETIETLYSFLEQVRSLCELDLSSTNLETDQIIEIITRISKNNFLQGFTLHLNNLSPNTNYLRIFKAFALYGLEKWKGLTFNDNPILIDHFKVFLLTLQKMIYLESVEFNNCFNESITGCGDFLLELLKIKALKRLSLRGGPNNSLGSELFNILKFLSAEFNNIEELDVSNNNLGDEGYDLLANLIKRNTKLKKLYYDQNNLCDIKKIDEILKSVEENDEHNFIELNLPLQDCKKFILSQNLHVQEKTNEIYRKQVKLMLMINYNRIIQGVPSPLPFEVQHKDIEDLIAEISENQLRSMRGNKITQHSLVCEELHIPLPYQNEYKVPDNVKQMSIGEMQVYQTKSMKNFVEEINYTAYRGIPFSTKYPPFMSLFIHEKTPEEEEREFLEKQKKEEEERKQQEQKQENAQQTTPEKEEPKNKIPEFKKKKIVDKGDDTPHEDDYSPRKSSKSNIELRKSPSQKKRKLFTSSINDSDIQQSSSSSSSDDDDFNYQIATRRVSKKQLEKALFKDYKPSQFDTSDSSDSYEEPAAEKAPKLIKKEIEDTSSDDDNSPPPSKNKQKQSRASNKNPPISSDSDEDTIPLPEPKRSKKSSKTQKIISNSSSTSTTDGYNVSPPDNTNKNPSSSSSSSDMRKPPPIDSNDSECDSDDVPPPKQFSEDNKNDDLGNPFDVSSSSDDKPPRSSKSKKSKLYSESSTQPPPKPKVSSRSSKSRKPISTSSSSDDDTPIRKSNPSKQQIDESSSSSDDDSTPFPPPKPHKTSKAKNIKNQKKNSSHSNDDEDSSSYFQPSPAPKPYKRKQPEQKPNNEPKEKKSHKQEQQKKNLNRRNQPLPKKLSIQESDTDLSSVPIPPPPHLQNMLGSSASIPNQPKVLQKKNKNKEKEHNKKDEEYNWDTSSSSSSDEKEDKNINKNKRKQFDFDDESSEWNPYVKSQSKKKPQNTKQQNNQKSKIPVFNRMEFSDSSSSND